MTEKFSQKEQEKIIGLTGYYQTMYYQYVIKPGRTKGLTQITVEDIEQYIIKSENSVGSAVGTSIPLDPRIANQVAQQLFDYYVKSKILDESGTIQPISLREQIRFTPGSSLNCPYEEYTKDHYALVNSQFSNRSSEEDTRDNASR